MEGRQALAHVHSFRSNDRYWIASITSSDDSVFRPSMSLLFPKPSGYPENLQILGDHIRARRLDLGLEQKDAAKIIGVTESSIWNWESNTHQPRKPLMIAWIIEFLGYCPLPPPTTRGEAIRYTRKIPGLNFKEAAPEIGVDPATLLTWESEQGRPDDPRCRGKLQAWLNVNASYVPLKPPLK